MHRQRADDAPGAAGSCSGPPCPPVLVPGQPQALLLPASLLPSDGLLVTAELGEGNFRKMSFSVEGIEGRKFPNNLLGSFI